MKKQLFFAATLVVAALFSSCGSTTITHRDARAAFIAPTVSAAPVEVDLEVQETKVSGLCSDANIFDAEQRRRNAIANALDNSGADILIEPSFTYTYNDGKLTTVKVTGFPGFYRNFHKAAPAAETAANPQVVVYGAQIQNTGTVTPAAPAPAKEEKVEAAKEDQPKQKATPKKKTTKKRKTIKRK